MTSCSNQNYKVPSTSKVSVDKLLRVGYYELERTIGKGNFAVVKLASNIVTKSKVAIKIIDKTALSEEYLSKTYREIAILKTLRHPHITRLYEVMESPKMLYLVTEHAVNGEIFDHLVENGRMKEPEAARIFTQLISAVQYCHGKGVVHRDLKAENVLLDKDMNIKLADFGFSNTYIEGRPLMTWCGSPPYAAPEVFQGFQYDGPKADIWSLGVVLYALVCGALPFDGKTLLELKCRVIAGKFRIPYFMSQDCELLIRNMLVVEPDRRYSIKQIINHRWLSEWSEEFQNVLRSPYGCTRDVSSVISDSIQTSINESSNLNSVVVAHMLQLPGLTADMIAQSVHESRFDNVYAIYNLLLDKLQNKRKEQQRLQHHANLVLSRVRKTSITTGVVDRSEPAKQDLIDRLSPLTNANLNGAGMLGGWTDVSVDLEKFSEVELGCLSGLNENHSNNHTHLSVYNSGTNGCNTRRHTVGPGDMTHEQVLANPNVPINFKYNTQDKPYLPVNLPSLQNQPLQNLTIKDQHLLKPPVVMGATGAFGRRASDGGANLHIYYPSSTNNVHQPQPTNDAYYLNINNSNKIESGMMRSDMGIIGNRVRSAHDENIADIAHIPASNLVGNALISDKRTEETSDEVQRYMQMRGCGKRHTVGCSDDLSVSNQTIESCSVDQSSISLPHSSSQPQSVVGGANRTRRTGLLTVMERPPVISPELIREVESRMNRNYLPPALKIQNTSSGINQSPPTNSPCNTTANCSNLPSAACSAINTNSRRYGRACKLPTVQEIGRYSPVRRASEGSKAQFQGPLQECQYLQKGLAQRHLLSAPSPPLLENSISLPGSPIHGKPIQQSFLKRGQNIEIPIDAVIGFMSILDRLVKDNRISVEIANNIISAGVVPIDLALELGLITHSGGQSHMDLNQIQQMYNSTAPSTMVLGVSGGGGNFAALSGPLNAGNSNQLQIGPFNSKTYGARSSLSHQVLLHHVAQPSNINSGFSNSASSSGSTFSSFTGSSLPSPLMPPRFTTAGSSPMHQITKGFSGLSTGGGGSITRGTSAASENLLNQPLDLSMDICCNEDADMYRVICSPMSSCQQLQPSPSINNWFTPSGYYDSKPLNLSSVQTVRVVPTPPASPNLCIIQEENANNHFSIPSCEMQNYDICTSSLDDLSPNHPSHPQICLTDVQGSEITLVALSSDNSRDSDCDTLEPHTSLMTLQGLIITEPSNDMPSITRGVGRKTSLENESNSRLETDPSTSAAGVPEERVNRRGSDKSLGFSDDSLSNDSNNLSPCQEPSASSGFKSDSHSEIGDPIESRLSPDSISDLRLTDEYYEVTLPHECSNLDSTRILEMVKQTIDSTMPPKDFTLKKANMSDAILLSNETPISLSKVSHVTLNANTSKFAIDSPKSKNIYIDPKPDVSVDISNLNLEYSGGLQIELQVCEGRHKDGNGVGYKGIKLRRISGDQFEYGKLCQQLTSTLTV